MFLNQHQGPHTSQTTSVFTLALGITDLRMARRSLKGRLSSYMELQRGCAGQNVPSLEIVSGYLPRQPKRLSNKKNLTPRKSVPALWPPKAAGTGDSSRQGQLTVSPQTSYQHQFNWKLENATSKRPSVQLAVSSFSCFLLYQFH